MQQPMTTPLRTTPKSRIIVSILFIQMVFFAAFACAEPSILPPADSAAASSSDASLSGDDTTQPRISLGYVKNIFVDTGTLITSPFRWETSDWLKVGAVAATTGALYMLDDNIRDFAQGHRSNVAHDLAAAGNDLGSPTYTLPAVGAFYLYGHLSDDAKARKTALLAIESLAISSMFTETIKVTAQRDRPNTGASASTWNGPHLSLKNLSFCSGHTSSAFSIATVFAEQYKETWYVPPIAYGLATLTGLARIYDNDHWASDVFFGAALGYFVGKAVVRLHPEKPDTKKRIAIAPVVGHDYKGLSVEYQF